MQYTEGDWVKKVTGDYTFYGRVVAVFWKLDGSLSGVPSDKSRVVVQNPAGILHIFSHGNLQPSDEREVLGAA